MSLQSTISSNETVALLVFLAAHIRQQSQTICTGTAELNGSSLLGLSHYFDSAVRASYSDSWLSELDSLTRRRNELVVTLDLGPTQLESKCVSLLQLG